MKGDFTRLGFDRGRAYSDVLLQQGRVALDADWNEQRAIDAAAREKFGEALIGAWGVPIGEAGFAVRPSVDGKSLTIGTGILYVGGTVCRNAAALAIEAQPDAPGVALPAATGRYLVYLDVWDQHVTALEDASLRDPALGGPDTATRIRTLWQARILPAAAGAIGANYAPGWAPDGGVSTGRLSAFLDPPAAGTSSVLPAASGYRAQSNQLYRIEIHQGGALGGAPAPTFKWSRDNGIVAAHVLSASGQALTLDDLGADDTLSFGQGQWVELVRPGDALNGAPGTLLLVKAVQPETMSVIIDESTALPAWAAAIDIAAGVLLRRWDQAAGADAGGVALTGLATELEYGLSVQFEDGFYRTGDYWTVPARVIPSPDTGNLLVPPDALPAAGIRHRYAPLALVDRLAGGAVQLAEDLRPPFEPTAGRALPFRADLGPGTAPLAPGAVLTTQQLAKGIHLSTATPFDGGSVTPLSVQLVAEIPVTLGEVMGAAGLSAGGDASHVVGTQAVSLACDLAVTGQTISLTPQPTAQQLLMNVLAMPATRSLSDIFIASDPNDWSLAGNGGAVFNGSTATRPFVARSVVAPAGPVMRLGASFVPPTTWGQPIGYGRFGIAFNIVDDSHFHLFYLDCQLNAPTEGGAPSPTFTYGLARYDGGTTPAVASVIGTGLSGAITLEIAQGPAGLLFGHAPQAGPASTLAFQGTWIPQTIDVGLPIGIAATGTAGASVRQFGWVTPGNQGVAPLPALAQHVLARVVARPALLRMGEGDAQGAVPSGTSAPDYQCWLQIAQPGNDFYGSAYQFISGLEAFGSGAL